MNGHKEARNPADLPTQPMYRDKIIIGIATLLAVFTLYFAERDDDLQRLTGVYRGKIFSNGLRDGTTTLSLNKEGGLVGVYVIAEKPDLLHGTLFDFQKNDNGRYHCRWVDTHGEGVLIISFDDDHDSFDGGWSSVDDSGPFYPWSGAKIAGP